jgi:hypothetical protein
MAETAAHLVDHVLPPLLVRQWVLSVPNRPRWYLEREPKAVIAVLHIFLRVVEAHLRRSCPEASARARFWAVSFVYRFDVSVPWAHKRLPGTRYKVIELAGQLIMSFAPVKVVSARRTILVNWAAL